MRRPPLYLRLSPTWRGVPKSWYSAVRRSSVALLLLAALTSAVACGGGSATSPVLYIGGIPDQEASTLNRLFGDVAEYLSRELDVEVKYLPSVDYAALVTAFQRGDVHLAWFGGLTGVQARAGLPGARAIAQRPRDAEFHSVFIVQSALNVSRLDDLRGLSFTFGSESSTSGHLMPRHFLTQVGLNPDKDFAGKPGYSGSHDTTWKLVESGAYQAGALNEAVWEAAAQQRKVDLSKVKVLYTTPPYYDYHWTAGDRVDATFGPKFVDRIAAALLALDKADPLEAKILDLFRTDRFISTTNENYAAIEVVARELDILR